MQIQYNFSLINGMNHVHLPAERRQLYEDSISDYHFCSHLKSHQYAS